MKTWEIAERLGVTERHARRLRAAGDPRIAALEKGGHPGGHPDITEAALEQACRELESEKPGISDTDLERALSADLRQSQIDEKVMQDLKPKASRSAKPGSRARKGRQGG